MKKELKKKKKKKNSHHLIKNRIKNRRSGGEKYMWENRKNVI